MLKDLHRMAVFERVVEAGSFSQAAVGLRLGKSVVSEHVAALEKSLGVTLLIRSTRSLSLTDEGRAFYDRCHQMLEIARAAREDLAQDEHPRGTIRLTCSHNLAVTFLIRMLAEFHDRYPQVVVDMVLEDALVNMIEQGFDLAIRVGVLSDTRMHAVPLGETSLVLCASREWLRRHPPVTRPEDLVDANWISISVLPHPDRIHLIHRDGRQQSLRFRTAARTSSALAAREFVREGIGISVLPDYSVRDDFAAGTLVRLLPEWREPTMRPVSVVYPRANQMPGRTRLLIDFLKTAFAIQWPRSLALRD